MQGRSHRLQMQAIQTKNIATFKGGTMSEEMSDSIIQEHCIRDPKPIDDAWAQAAQRRGEPLSALITKKGDEIPPRADSRGYRDLVANMFVFNTTKHPISSIKGHGQLKKGYCLPTCRDSRESEIGSGRTAPI